MNNERRKTIASLIDDLENLQGEAQQLQERASDIKDAIEELRDEEEDAFNNLPESFQNGEKGQASQTAIESLGTALDRAEEVSSLIEGAIDEADESAEALREASE